MITIKDIQNHTGLSDPYIRRVLRTMKGIFDPMTNRGERNLMLFEENALAVFDRVKQKKEEGLSLRDIKKSIQKEMNPPSEGGETGSKLGVQFVKEVEQEGQFDRVLNEKNERIIELLQNENRNLRQTVKLLPVPDSEKIKEVAYLFAKLENITRPKFFKNKEARETWARLRELLGLGSGSSE